MDRAFSTNAFTRHSLPEAVERVVKPSRRAPGEGDLDFQVVFDALHDVGYDGFATLELYTNPGEPDRAAERAYRELRAVV